MTDIPTAGQCPICGGDASLVQEEREVRYGRRAILVDDEFMRCDTCGETYYVGDQMAATDARAAARSRQQHGALLPFEIRALRERLGLTQEQLEVLLDVGQKTVVRWESGTVIPNPATNTLLRLLEADPRNVHVLREMRGLGETVQWLTTTALDPAVISDTGETTYVVPTVPSDYPSHDFWAKLGRPQHTVVPVQGDDCNGFCEELVA